MEDQLGKLVSDLASYREAVDHLLFLKVSEVRKWREQLLDILVNVSQLYLDYLLLKKERPVLEAACSEGSVHEILRADLHREASLRKLLKERLKSSPHWNRFDPKNEFSELTGLRTLQDYLDKLVLHLPEIYEESFRAEKLTRALLTDRKQSILAQLVVSMEHIERNHVTFVQQPLEWAVNEQNWDES